MGRVYGTTSLVSFVHLAVDARRASAGAVVRLVPSKRLSPEGDRLMSGTAAQLIFSDGGTFDGAAVRYAVPAGQVADVYAGWLNRPAQANRLKLDQETYLSALDTVTRFWEARLAGPTQFAVPDERVVDAQRGVLIQELLLAWRYSVGNAYEELSFVEALDVAQVLASYGFDDIARAILRYTRARLPGRFTSWRAGELLVADALYYRLYRDRAFLERETPRVARALEALSQRITPRGGSGLLDRELYSSDVGREVYGLHGQAVALQGLRAMGRVWAQTGHPGLAASLNNLGGLLQAQGEYGRARDLLKRGLALHRDVDPTERLDHGNGSRKRLVTNAIIEKVRIRHREVAVVSTGVRHVLQYYPLNDAPFLYSHGSPRWRIKHLARKPNPRRACWCSWVRLRWQR